MPTELMAPLRLDPEAVQLANACLSGNAGFSKLNWAVLANTEALEQFDRELGSALDEVVEQVRGRLLNPEQGIAVVDIPSLTGVDHATDMWLGSALAVVLGSRLYSARIDETTKLPFTVYNASRSGEEALKAEGIKYFSPEQNLGFHTDGIVSEGTLCAPRFVSIYNVFLGYKKPGSFYWVPFSRWTERGKWIDRIGDRKFKLEITPITFRSRDGAIKVRSQGSFDVRLFVPHEDEVVPFFNGEIVSCIDDERFEMSWIKDMLKSVEGDSTRIKIPLQARRLFILNNWRGAHARDIFEEPIGQNSYTRSFFRSMDDEVLSFRAA